MAKARTLVGLDVHATKVVAAVLDAETGALQFFGMKMDVRLAAGLHRKLNQMEERRSVLDGRGCNLP